MQNFIDTAGSLLVIELSFARQFHRYLKSELTLPRDTRVYARSGGKNLTVTEVMTEALRALAATVQHDEVLA
jgi:hypothetical protein